MKYEIEIFKNDDDHLEDFEKDFDNVGEVRVFNENHVEITSDCYVEIFLSKNGLLGLGTELIRLAQNFKETKHFHLERSQKDQKVQKMGIFLSPESAELIICCSQEKKIDDYFE